MIHVVPVLAAQVRIRIGRTPTPVRQMKRAVLLTEPFGRLAGPPRNRRAAPVLPAPFVLGSEEVTDYPNRSYVPDVVTLEVW